MLEAASLLFSALAEVNRLLRKDINYLLDEVRHSATSYNLYDANRASVGLQMSSDQRQAALEVFMNLKCEINEVRLNLDLALSVPVSWSK